jgi:two-component system sensor histidine kinase/response regulator
MSHAALGDAVLFFQTDAEGRLTRLSEAAARLLGAPPTALLGAHWQALLRPTSAAALRELSARNSGHASTQQHEVVVEHPDGGTRNLLVTFRVMHGPGGEERGIDGLAVDVTAQRQEVDTLRQRLDGLRGAFDYAGVGIGEFDPEIGWLAVNPELARLLGRPAAALLGASPLAACAPEDRPRLRALIADIVDGQRTRFSLEIRLLRHDHPSLWADLQVSRERPDQPFIAVIEDIQARHQAELGAAIRSAELAAIRRAQQLLLLDPLPAQELIFGDLIGTLIALTGAEIGLLAERTDPVDDEVTCRILAIRSVHHGRIAPSAAIDRCYCDLLLETTTAAHERVVVLDDGALLFGQPIAFGDGTIGAIALKIPADRLDPGRVATLRLMAPAFGQLLGDYRAVDARSRAHSLLTEREEEARQLARIVSQIDNAVLLGDSNGRIRWVNTSFSQIFGYTLEEARGRCPRALLDGPHSDPALWKRCDEAARGVGHFRANITLHAKGGAPRWVEVEGQMVTDTDGRPCLMALIRDRSAFRAAEERFIESEARLRAIGDAHDGIAIRQVIFSAHGSRHVYASAGAAALWDCDGELTDVDPVDLLARVPEYDRRAVIEAGVADWAAGRPVHAELPIQLRGGGTRWISMNAAPRRLADGALIWDTIDIDITARKALEASLREAMNEAEAANRAKSMFLAHVSHELRTPLNGILGLTELLLDEPLPAGLSERLEIVHRSGEWLLDLVNDLLDFARIEAGKLAIEPAPFEIEREFGHALKSFAVRARRKGLSLALELATDLKCEYIGDRARIRQIVANLVGNAIKFTEAGGVFITVEARPLGDSEVDLHVRVRDTGIGVPRERQAKIFEPFEQGDLTTGRRYGGTGLGLAICTRLIAMMGGSIGVDSVPGQGSTFWFTVRLRASDGAPSIAERNNELARALWHSDIRAHVVPSGDAPALAATLSAWGVEIVADERGAYDLAVIDATGAPLRQRIDSVRSAGFRGPILAISDALAPREELAADPEISTVLRPYTPSELLSRIVRLLRHHPVTTAASTARIPHFRVLVAEDNEVNQIVANDLLSRAGHELRVVADGAAALEICQREYFDLILMDIQMDGMDGIAATEAIRAREQGGPRVPIIGLTAHAMPDDIERCKAAGMDSVITKPFRIATLYQALGELASPLTPAPSAILGRVGGDRQLLAQIAEIFARTAPSILAELRQAIAAGDAQTVVSRAHRLAGAVANFDALEALGAARRLEELARQGHLTGADAALRRLEAAVDGLSAALAQLSAPT